MNEKKFNQYLNEFEKVLAKFNLKKKQFLKHSRLYNAGTIFLVNRIKNSIPSGRRILEIGPGIGFLSSILAKEGYKVFGIEVEKPRLHDPKEINYPREKYRKLVWEIIKKQTGAKLKIYDSVHFPFSKNQFDAVILDAVFEHIKPINRQVITDEIYRVLKKGGFIFVSRCPSRFSYSEFLANLFNKGHSRLLSFKDLRNSFKEDRFKLVNKQKTDMVINFLPGMGTPFLNLFFPIFKVLDIVLLKTPLRLLAHNWEVTFIKK